MEQRRPNNRRQPGKDQRQPSEFEQKVVNVSRVTRVVAGGKRMRFRALVVVGDRKGKVGFGLAKGLDVQASVNKAVNQAKKQMIVVPLKNGTIPNAVDVKFKASRLYMKPGRVGSGVVAGGPVRSIMEVAGIQSISCKMLGGGNAVSNIQAVFRAFNKLKMGEQAKKLRASAQK
jgi:small subunit ribosomal protein S5